MLSTEKLLIVLRLPINFDRSQKGLRSTRSVMGKLFYERDKNKKEKILAGHNDLL